MFFWSVLFGVFLAVHHVSGFKSCAELKGFTGIDEDGIYHLVSSEGYEYQAFCDMTTDGGGWTMVASIHENNIKGRCTVDDVWSSQQGKLQVNGDGTWRNRVIFGTVEGATSGDYKNPGYFDIDIYDIALWHVPNIVRVNDWKHDALLRYRTTDGYFGGGMNLYKLFKQNPMERNPNDLTGCRRGTQLPVQYDEGDNERVRRLHGSLVQAEIDTGYVTLRPWNRNGVPFAICPGVKIKDSSSACSFQHYCIGGGGFQGSDYARVCGDFNNFDGKGEGTPAGWVASSTLTESSIIIFYR